MQNKMYKKLEDIIHIEAYRTLGSDEFLAAYSNADILSSTPTHTTVKLENDNIIL